LQVLVLPLNTPLTASLLSLAVGFLAFLTTRKPASARPAHSASRQTSASASRATNGRRCMADLLERERGLGEGVAGRAMEVDGALDLERDARARSVLAPHGELLGVVVRQAGSHEEGVLLVEMRVLVPRERRDLADLVADLAERRDGPDRHVTAVLAVAEV